MTEREAMQRALELARSGWGRVAPNPLVGAVLLRDDRIVGEGYHAEFGGPHAERAALAACEDPRRATCVVTLEPCAHHGKTPPCTDALVESGVTRVVIAVRDPHPEARGGADRLREAGIDVAVGEGAAEAAALNAPFLFNATEPDRPYVALKLAASVDGFLADASGASTWISGPEARDYVHWLRAGFDAIGVGARTLRIDDPQLTVRGKVVPRVPPMRVVFAGGDPLPDRRRVWDVEAAPTTVLIPGPGVAPAVEVLDNYGVRVTEAATLAHGLESLRREGVGSILIEGGGRLAGALLAADLVDRLYWIQAPRWLGEGVPAFGRRPARPLAESEGWTVTERRALGADTLLVIDRRLCLPG